MRSHPHPSQTQTQSPLLAPPRPPPSSSFPPDGSTAVPTLSYQRRVSFGSDVMGRHCKNKILLQVTNNQERPRVRGVWGQGKFRIGKGILMQVSCFRFRSTAANLFGSPLWNFFRLPSRGERDLGHVVELQMKKVTAHVSGMSWH